MGLPDRAKRLRLDRARRRLHRHQELAHQAVVELVTAGHEQAVQARALQPDLFEDRLAFGAAAEPVELGEEIAQNADSVARAVMGQEGAGETFEVSDAIPVRGSRGRGCPFRPARVARLVRSPEAQSPPAASDTQAQVRVEIGEARYQW